MQTTQRRVSDYIDELPDNYKSDVSEINKAISEHMPGITPKMWEGVFWGGSEQSIIGYGDMTYTRSDKKIVEWFSVGLSLQKNYISVYITATDDGMYVVKKYSDKLGRVKTGSSSVSFKKLDDVNLDELLKLVDIAYDQLPK
jgi:hypothetical protein